MQIVYVAGDTRRELDVRVNNPAATVADLVRALDPTARDDRTLLIGDQPVDPDFELGEAGLHEGAVVRLGHARPGGAWRPAPTAPLGDGLERELVVISGLDAGRRFPLAPGVTVLGRTPGCDVVLDHPTVSKRHAQLTVSEGAAGDVTIADLESHNGTWVNGLPVVRPAALEPGVPGGPRERGGGGALRRGGGGPRRGRGGAGGRRAPPSARRLPRPRRDPA